MGSKNGGEMTQCLWKGTVLVLQSRDTSATQHWGLSLCPGLGRAGRGEAVGQGCLEVWESRQTRKGVAQEKGRFFGPQSTCS